MHRSTRGRVLTRRTVIHIGPAVTRASPRPSIMAVIGVLHLPDKRRLHLARACAHRRCKAVRVPQVPITLVWRSIREVIPEIRRQVPRQTGVRPPRQCAPFTVARRSIYLSRPIQNSSSSAGRPKAAARDSVLGMGVVLHDSPRHRSFGRPRRQSMMCTNYRPRRHREQSNLRPWRWTAETWMYRAGWTRHHSSTHRDRRAP